MAELKNRASPEYFAESGIAVKSLLKDFSVFSERSKPYLPVKSVLAAVFMWQCGKVIGCYAGLLILVTSFLMRMVQSCLRRLIRSVVSCASVYLISELA